jgi:hypothetical protein
MQVVSLIDPILNPLQRREALRLKYIHADIRHSPATTDVQSWLMYPVVHPTKSTLSQIKYGMDFSSLDRRWVPGRDWTVSFEKASSLQEASRIWRRFGSPLYGELTWRRTDLINEAVAITDAQASAPLVDFPSDVADTAMAIPSWFVLWAGINFLFGGLGRLIAIRPPARRRSRA